MIAVLTPMGSTLYGATRADIQNVKDARRDIATAGLFAGAHLQDKLIYGCIDAIANKATHIAIIEADMRVPMTAITTLLGHHRDIVGANYRQRQQNRWTALTLDGQNLSSVGKTGLERVSMLGCGCILIDVRVFVNLPQPWFSAPWSLAHGYHEGIDHYFCRHAEAHGFWSWCDHDLSQDVRHIAEIELSVDGARYLGSQQPLLIQWVDA